MTTTPQIKHWLVLGAGASYGARLDSAVPPPLGSGLAGYLSSWLDLNNYTTEDWRTAFGKSLSNDLSCPPKWLFTPQKLDLARGFLNDCSGTGYEKTVDAYLTREMRLNDQLNAEYRRHNDVQQFVAAFLKHEENSPKSAVLHANAVLACSMLTGTGCAFDERPDLYDALLALELFRHGVGIITTNYDLLIEEALGRLYGADFHAYPADKWARALPIPLYKIHGSCNWLGVFPQTSSPSEEVARKLARDNPVGTSGPHGGHETNLEDTQHHRRSVIMKLKDDHDDPGFLIAAYGPEKPVFRNYKYIERTQTLCLDAIRNNPDASVTFIGITLASAADDPRLAGVTKALAAVRGEKTYVDPVAAARAKAQELGFHGFDGGLVEFIEKERQK